MPPVARPLGSPVHSASGCRIAMSPVRNRTGYNTRKYASEKELLAHGVSKLLTYSTSASA